MELPNTMPIIPRVLTLGAKMRFALPMICGLVAILAACGGGNPEPSAAANEPPLVQPAKAGNESSAKPPAAPEVILPQTTGKGHEYLEAAASHRLTLLAQQHVNRWVEIRRPSDWRPVVNHGHRWVDN